MLLITTTHQPAIDLGYLLHKNPGRVHEAKLTFGSAWVVYPEASDERCTAAVMLDIDPVGLVRRREGAGSLSQYVNDRPYVASSFLSVALIELFSTAISGRSKDRPGLAEQPIPLEIRVPVLSCRSAEERIARLFVPLGYEVTATRLPLDDTFPEWGETRSAISICSCRCSMRKSTTTWTSQRSTNSLPRAKAG
jgi:3' terminal RNA ribose 2'-O-methyltransferase Hen1